MNPILRLSIAGLINCADLVFRKFIVSPHVLAILTLFHFCLSVSAQDDHVTGIKTVVEEGEAVQANFTGFPSREAVPEAVWRKINANQPYSAQTSCYKIFTKDSVKYAEVVNKRNAYESYYVNPLKPSVFSIEKGLYPINFKRNGEWIPIDPQLKPMGNGLYEAPDQWNAVGIDVKDHQTAIYTNNGKVYFNNWTLYGVNGNNRTELAKASWSHYTIGADGIRIIDVFPGMDAEMRVSRGGIKTSFIIHQLKFAGYSELYFEDAFKGLREKGLYYQDGNTNDARVEAVYADVANEAAAIKIAPALGYAKKSSSLITNFPYHISANKLSIAVPVDFVVNNLVNGDVIIDPVVQSANSMAQSLIGTMYNASCGFGNYCEYTIPVTPPANATLTLIATQTNFIATAPCGLENLAYQVIMGSCIHPGPGLVVISGTSGPGTIFPGYRVKPALLACAPAPSCAPTPVNVTFRLFRGCVGPAGCDNTCVGLVNPLAVLIQGQTAELTTVVTSPAPVCPGGVLDFSTSTAYGVPPYGNIEWSYSNTFASLIGTGAAITVPNTFAPGTYSVYARATDACGSVASTSKSFTINQPPVATLPAGETICNGATTNIIPSSSIAATTYGWTVVQTGVTGASAGTGTSIVQTLVNTGTAPGTAVYTITPTANGCPGTPITYTVTVKPVNNVLYVDDVNGNDANCGDAWTNSLKTLSTALQIAKTSANVDSILVAKGTYYPTGAQNGTKRDSSFLILRGKLKLFGGYPNGGGTRDVAANATVLSGDIGAANDTIDNSYHVMVVVDIPAAADSIVIDGFTFTKGNADAGGLVTYGTQALYQGHGAGLYMQYDQNGQKTALRNLTFSGGTAKILGAAIELVFSSPYIANCTFSNNRTYTYGGAIANDHSASPYVTNCTFTGNIAHIAGGAVFTQESASRPNFINCSFTGNSTMPAPSLTSSTWGGVMFNRTAAVVNINRCIFTANHATMGGGAICNDGNSTMEIRYSVFDSNVAIDGTGKFGAGGAIIVNAGAVNLYNTVLFNNIAGGTTSQGGGALAITGTLNCYNVTMYGNSTQSTINPTHNGINIQAGSTVIFRNSIAWGPQSAQIGGESYGTGFSLIKGLAATLPDLSIDPQFVDPANPIGADGAWFTADDGLQLTSCSPAANMGRNLLVPAGITTDMAGNARIVNTNVDMGAYELQVPVTPLAFTNVVKTYGDPDAPVPNFTNCTGLPTTFTIADASIATMAGDNLHILKAGVTTIMAHTINGTPDVTVTLTVNPKPATISLIAPVTKVYDGNANAIISTANLQLAPGDIIGADDVSIALSSTAALYDTKDAGTGKTVTVPLANISLTGTAAANYVIANTADVSAAIGVITPLAVTITADAQTKTYGDADPALTYNVIPALAPGDAFTGVLDRAAGENTGIYAISQGTMALNSNYTITYNGNTLTITPKTIVITVDAKTKGYGDADPALTYTYAPALVGTDVFSGSLVRNAGENVGAYPINRGSLALSSNYTLVYTGNNLTITPKTITVTADARTKTYGDADPVLTYTYAPALVGTDVFSGSLVRNAGENVGAYPVNQGSLALNGNYILLYTGDNLTITAKTITVTANAVIKTYGDADPAFTYTYAPALMATDVFTGVLNRVQGENVGSYAINQNTLALSSNYQLVYTGASLLINKAVLTVTAQDKTICLNDALTTVPVSYTGFKNGDAAASLATPPSVSIPSYNNAGNYPLTPQGGGSANYTFNYVAGNLTVLPLPVGAIRQTQLGPGAISTPGIASGVQLSAPTGAGYTYAWSSGENSPSIAVTSNGNYQVVVTNPQGCSTSFTTRVLQQTLIIPNIFSPNGDGIHDRWVIENLQNYPGNVVQIYNRYGQAVLKTTNYTPWDGRVNGKEMPVGTYYYIIDPKNGQKPVTGYIDIIR